MRISDKQFKYLHYCGTISDDKVKLFDKMLDLFPEIDVVCWEETMIFDNDGNTRHAEWTVQIRVDLDRYSSTTDVFIKGFDLEMGTL